MAPLPVLCPRLSLLVVLVVFVPSTIVLGASPPVVKPSNTSASKTPKVCDVCACTADEVNCSNRDLDNNLSDYEWPRTLLKVITFENNRISHVKPFTNITVIKLTFRSNKIKNIDNQAFKWLANLTELDLSHNFLTHENFMPHSLEGQFTPEAYEPLAKLKLLNLSGNQFTTLNRDLFEHVEDLKFLILSNNPFVNFSKAAINAISSIAYLEELDLSYCQLTDLDAVTLHSLSALKKLDLSWNKFSKLPDALQQSNSLETVILDGNPIEMLDHENGFSILPKVKELSMNHMMSLLTIDDGALSNLQALEVLRITNCSLLEEISNSALAKKQEIGGTIYPSLKILDLSSNALHYLPSNLLARWDKLQELHLLNNPWSCDCENQYLIGTLLPGRTKLENEGAKLRCATPPEHVNKSLASLSGRKLRCLDTYGARPERDAAVLVGMLVGILLAIPMILAFFILWSRGYFFCRPQGPASFSRAFYRRTPPYDDDM